MEPDKTFEVTMAMSSSLIMISFTGENIIVGSDAVLITENVSLHLNATLLSIAPNSHICGKNHLMVELCAAVIPSIYVLLGILLCEVFIVI